MARWRVARLLDEGGHSYREIAEMTGASTTTVTADVMTDVRSQGERADDAVAGFVDRMLGRRERLRGRQR